MEQFKRAKVIMLPTKDITKLRTYCGSQLHISNSTFKEPYYQDQHLYIISDDEIKEGDWFIDKLQYIQKQNGSYNTSKMKAKKIIATTDKSLKIPTHYGMDEELPEPSQQFIEKYIEKYNKGEIITDVLVEYENKFDHKHYVDDQDAYGYDIFKNILKINPKDNTITIKKVKDSWSREEIIAEIKKYAKDSLNVDRYKDIFFTNKWIEENL